MINDAIHGDQTFLFNRNMNRWALVSTIGRRCNHTFVVQTAAVNTGGKTIERGTFLPSRYVVACPCAAAQRELPPLEMRFRNAHRQENFLTLTFRTVTAFAFVLVSFCGVETAVAQPARDARVVLTAGGPTAAVRTLEFSADSRRLYAAGADKSVEIWSVTEARGPAPDLKLVDHARWPIARHDRGQIWTVAVNDAKNLIAFGGYGAQQINGDISIADSIHGLQLSILPPPLPDEDPQQRFVTGHLNTVTSVSFSPNGEWLASISLDGELRLWSAANWTSQQVLAVGENPAFSDLFVQFISNTEFVASLNPSIDKDKPAPQLRRFTIGADGAIIAEVLASPHRGLITALGRDA